MMLKSDTTVLNLSQERSIVPDNSLRMADLPDAEKIRTIEYHFEKIMVALGLDLSDDSLKNTPMRVAKMYVNEAFRGLNPLHEPPITLFENSYNYNEIILEKNIPVYSCCEHHFVPIVGKAHVAYIPQQSIAGLSKLNRAVEYFSKRPQVQERLTLDIARFLQDKLQTPDVAVIIDAEHLCIASRGIGNAGCSTTTASYFGAFEKERRTELFQLIR